MRDEGRETRDEGGATKDDRRGVHRPSERSERSSIVIMAEEKFDCIIVGAGLAGTSAAYLLAKAGLDVLVMERGDFPGAKNMMGGVLYTHPLEKILPEFWKEAPLERQISEQQFWLTAPNSTCKLGYKSGSFNRAPYNCFSVLRAKFDPWFAKKAEEAGAELVTGQKVEDLIYKKGRFVGVRSRVGGREGEAYADVIILADGVNSILARKAGLHSEISSQDVALGVKEVLALPGEKIAERFNLSREREGTAIYLFGSISKGMMGMGFIYTNLDSISIGLGVTLKDYIDSGLKPYELLEELKHHPLVEPLIEGGQPREYSAHFIPEGGYKALPRLYAGGLLVVGDAAGLVNSLFREGSNLAITSGQIAASTVLKAEEDRDFSRKSMARYQVSLESSFVLKDLKDCQWLPQWAAAHPEVFRDYPQILNEIAYHFFTVDDQPKKKKFQMFSKLIRKNIGILKMGGLFWQARKLFK